MKKNITIISSIVLSLSLLAFFGFKMSNKIKDKKATAERIQQIPAFSFYSLNDEKFTNDNLSIGSKTLFIYFNSECEFCQEEIAQINQNIDYFKGTQLIFISHENKSAIAIFADKYKALKGDNIHFLYDDKATFSTIFDAKSVPFALVYDSNKQLVGKFKGITKVYNLAESLSNAK
ncbi:TlpA family protein disulfide reductase [Sungkyunkwania multivorans]|uniref:TlpA family protein disulfide reductase n=1 Tax=Sungkyunkwania multivorans TaxID=1173618 RepID=A0ABW3D0Q6_9FLAO